MKKYFCDRCNISLIDEAGSVRLRYNMKDPKCKRLRRNKNEQFVCAECVEAKLRESASKGDN